MKVLKNFLFSPAKSDIARNGVSPMKNHKIFSAL